MGTALRALTNHTPRLLYSTSAESESKKPRPRGQGSFSQNSCNGQQLLLVTDAESPVSVSVVVFRLVVQPVSTGGAPT